MSQTMKTKLGCKETRQFYCKKCYLQFDSFASFFRTFLRLILYPYEQCNHLLSHHRVLMQILNFWMVKCSATTEWNYAEKEEKNIFTFEDQVTAAGK